MKKNKKNYFWLAIEGTDGVGKTSLLKEVKRFLSTQEKINFTIIKEFSDSQVGDLIKGIIKKKKFFSLGENTHYSFSETLLLATDFVYQFEKILSRHSSQKKLFIVSDRGIHSFFTYQLTRIKLQYQISPLMIKKWIKDIFWSIRSPDFVVLLISPINDIKKRIIGRDGSVTNKELHFVQEIQDEYLKILKENSDVPYLILENRNGDFKKVVTQTLEKIKALTENKK